MSNTKEKDDFQNLYTKFINNLELKEIYLKSANISYLERPNLKTPTLVKIKDSARLELLSKNKFKVYKKYNLEVKQKEGEEQTYLRITCEFVVLYYSEIVPGDKIFKQFKNSTLRLNTWPYFREFAHNTIARMNLPPMITPLLKT